MAMAASSALQPERCLLPLAGPRRRHQALRMLPPRLLVLPHRRRGAVRRFSSKDGGGGSAGALEKRSVVPEVAAEKKGGGDAHAEEFEEKEEAAAVDGALELRWPPWEGLPERYRLIGATSLAFVICNMDKHGRDGANDTPCGGPPEQIGETQDGGKTKHGLQQGRRSAIIESHHGCS